MDTKAQSGEREACGASVRGWRVPSIPWDTGTTWASKQGRNGAAPTVEAWLWDRGE